MDPIYPLVLGQQEEGRSPLAEDTVCGCDYALPAYSPPAHIPSGEAIHQWLALVRGWCWEMGAHCESESQCSGGGYPSYSGKKVCRVPVSVGHVLNWACLRS